MTKLVKMTLKNFKSFKKAEVPISNGFTAIVGSNGSGKSNVLDALLFVLGITSLKTLRAAKLTDLVYNNAKENYAKVDLIIKDNGKLFEVSRMIDKQGKSVYRLDGKRTTLNEVNSLLVELGIDIHGHNIVTQGDITKIIAMSPIERREIIDTIAGLSEFDLKKEEALKELNKVDSRIKEATIILNERNSFLEELEQEMTAATEFEELDKEKKSIKATIISKELYSIEKRNNELDKELKELEKEREEIEKNLENIRKEIGELKNKSNELSSKAVKGSEEIYMTIGREFEEKKSKLGLEKERVSVKEREIKNLEEKINFNNSYLEKSKHKEKEMNEKVQEIHNKKKKIESELEEIAKKKKELEEVVKTKNSEIIHIESDLDKANKEIDSARKEVFDLEVFAKQWEKQKSFNEKRLAELNEESKKLDEELSAIESNEKEINLFGGKQGLLKKEEELDRQISSKMEEKSNINSIIKQESEAIKELKKEISKCPICDSNLEEKKKREILEKKEKIVSEKKEELIKVERELNNLKEKNEELEEKKERVNELSAENNRKNRIEEMMNEVKQKISKIKQDLDEKTFEAQLNKRNRMSLKLKEMIGERDNIRNKLDDIRSQNVFETYSEVSKKYGSLIHNNMLLGNELSEVVIDQNKINTKKEEILIENEELSKEIKEKQGEIEEKRPSLYKMEEEIKGKENELGNARKKNEDLMKEKEKIDAKIEKTEKDIYSDSGKIKKIEGRINDFNIEKSKLEVRQTDLEEEGKEFEGFEKIGEKTIEELKERAVKIEKRLEEIGAVNLKAVDNFKDLKTEVEEIQVKANKLEEERLAVLDMIDKIDVKRTNVFMECFGEVNKNFSDMFSKFFNGEGLLDLTNPDQPLESGLLIDARPKEGKLQNIDSMSGGEKTLTALAFMFAIQLYSPAPFYAFDEADAALDKENSLKMGGLIEKIAEKSQFIAITHNDTITKKASQIIGVALNKDNSSVIGLKLKQQNN